MKVYVYDTILFSSTFFFLSTRKSSCVKIWGKLNLAFAVDFLAFDTNRIKAQPKKSDAALAKANIFVRFSAHSSETHPSNIENGYSFKCKKKKKGGGWTEKNQNVPRPSVETAY